jgi:hypothetical protein
MKNWVSVILIAVFVLVTKPEGESVREYHGIKVADVEASLTASGLTYSILTEAEYRTKRSALELATQKELETPQRVAEKRQAALDVKDRASDQEKKLGALIILLDLDQ